VNDSSKGDFRIVGFLADALSSGLIRPRRISAAVMADADHGTGIRLRRVGPGLLAFGQVGDPLLNFIETVDNGLVLRLLAVFVDDPVAFRRRRVDLALLLGGRRRPFRCGPAETLGGFR